MSFNVNDFRAQMTGDGARPNLFEIVLTPPGVADRTLSEKVKFMAKAAQLPGTAVGTVPVYYFGRELKFPGNRTFADWTITVINDEDFYIRKYMEKWMSNINSHRSNQRAATYDNNLGYSAEADVYQFKKTGEYANGYRFVGMFPIDISPIELDWGTNDSIEEFTVTFAYQYWEASSGYLTEQT